MVVVGWSCVDWKVFHDLKVKASLYNLEVAKNILSAEIPMRAEQMILAAYQDNQEWNGEL